MKDNCFTELCWFLPNIISKLDIEGKFLNLIESSNKSTVNITLNNEKVQNVTSKIKHVIIFSSTHPNIYWYLVNWLKKEGIQ